MSLNEQLSVDETIISPVQQEPTTREKTRWWNRKMTNGVCLPSRGPTNSAIAPPAKSLVQSGPTKESKTPWWWRKLTGFVSLPSRHDRKHSFGTSSPAGAEGIAASDIAAIESVGVYYINNRVLVITNWLGIVHTNVHFLFRIPF